MQTPIVSGCGDIPWADILPCVHGHQQRYQSWRDLGRSGRFLCGYVDALAAPAPRHPHQPPRRSWRFSLDQPVWLPGGKSRLLEFHFGKLLSERYFGPLQLHHSTTDEEVPLEFSETLFYQMLDVNKYVEFYKYEGDNHNISNNFSTAMQRSIEFFDRYVKNIGS